MNINITQGYLWRSLKNRITKNMYNMDTRDRIKVAFHPLETVGSIFSQLLYQTPLQYHSKLVYKIPCNDCNQTYIGMIKDHTNQHARD